MPIIVVTEGDFVGINYIDKVSSDINNRPFRAIIPLSQLLDPKRKEESVALIYSQLPKGDALTSFAYHILLTQALKAGITPKSAAENIAIQTCKSYSAHDLAIFTYNTMKDEASKLNIKPKSRLTERQLNEVQSGLATCKPWIADCANAMDVKIFIIRDDRTILEENCGGVSTGSGVYVKADNLQDANTVREEVLHEVERSILSKKINPFNCFSSNPAFMKAISKDVEDGQNNLVYRYVVQALPEFLAQRKIRISFDYIIPTYKSTTLTKANIGLKKSQKTMPKILDKNRDSTPLAAFIPYAEALTDLYHIEAMVKSLAEHKIKLGGVVGLGEDTTPDDVMRAAFPNSWPLLEGPRVGKELVQFADGRVKEIPKDGNFPERALRVTSLREHCESWLKEHGQEMAKAGDFASTTPKRKESYAEQEKDKPESEHSR